MATKEALLAILEGSGQEHVVADYDSLTAAEQAVLSAQVSAFTNTQWKHMNAILRDSLDLLDASNTKASNPGEGHGTALAMPTITPPPKETIFDLPRLTRENSAELAAIRTAGQAVIAEGRGAVLLMAGGSGTRLGVTIPKGLFHCELLPSGRSLFEYHCCRVRKAEMLAAAAAVVSEDVASPSAGRGLLPLLVMTSDQNDAATKAFFRDHSFFGLLPEQVIFFRQSSLPCYDEATGKVLMEERGKICLAPGGNGGVYESLARSSTTTTAAATAAGTDGASVLAQLVARGTRYVQIFSVDNILAKLGDPVFFGLAAARRAEVVVKTVPKAAAEERVGVFALTDGEWGVVEYTEIGTARAAERSAASGELTYNCGNIASHCCSVDFLKLAAKDMETSTFYHAARKNMATVRGTAPAIKMEAFIFDEFKLAKKVPTRPANAELPDPFQIMQVDRSAEFAPIKNAEGAAADTATTAAQLLLALHTQWVVDALTAAPEAAEGRDGDAHGYSAQARATALQRLRDGVCRWEISPLVSYGGEGLLPYVPQLIRRTVEGEGVLGLEDATQSRANM